MLTTTVPVEDKPPESVARTRICKQKKCHRALDKREYLMKTEG